MAKNITITLDVHTAVLTIEALDLSLRDYTKGDPEVAGLEAMREKLRTFVLLEENDTFVVVPATCEGCGSTVFELAGVSPVYCEDCNPGRETHGESE